VNTRLLTEADFTARYGVPARTLQRWRATGDGPPYCRIGPRKIAYPEAGAEQWLASRTFAHRADELSRKQRGAA
jgi:predicted DNA-binding transcriptional regulator AlpA